MVGGGEEDDTTVLDLSAVLTYMREGRRGSPAVGPGTSCARRNQSFRKLIYVL